MLTDKTRPIIELSHFIWAELERLEIAAPVYECAGVGAYEAMHECLHIAAELYPAVWCSDEPWTSVLYDTCPEVAQAIHTYMAKRLAFPAWADLGEFLN